MTDPDYAVKPSAERLRDLLAASIRSRNQEVEDHCHAAIDLVLGEKSEKSYRNPKDMTKKMLASRHTPQELNFHLRFQTPWSPSNAPQRRDSFTFGTAALVPNDYESVTDDSILTAPMSDICIISKNEVVPEGYYRITRTPTGKKANLNSGTGGAQLYFCIKKVQGATENSPTISSLALIYPDRDEYPPPGYSVAKRNGKPCNINYGTSCERIFLGFKREALNSPIIDISIFLRSPKDEELIPPNFIHLNKSIKNHDADLNMSTSGPFIGLCYRQELTALKCLSEFKPQKSRLARRTTMDIGMVFDEVLDPRPSANSRRSTNFSFDTSENIPPDEFEYMNMRDGIDEEESCRNLSNASLSEMDGAGEDVGNLDTRTPDRVEQNSTSSLTQRSEDTSSDATIRNTDLDNISPSPLRIATESPKKNEHGKSMISVFSSRSMFNNSVDKIVILSAHGVPLPRNVALIMLALLSGIYCTGEVFDVSMDILTFMVEDLSFFAEELKSTPRPGSYTILDLFISILCEKLDWCVEPANVKILALLQSLIKRSSGILSKSSTQQIFKGSMFVSSCLSTSSTWMTNGFPLPKNDDDSELFSYKVLKTLINSLCMRCEECPVDYHLPTCLDMANATDLKRGISLDGLNLDFNEENEVVDDDSDDGSSTGGVSDGFNVKHLKAQGDHYCLVVDVVTDLIDSVIDSVEVSKITELALLATSRKTSSTYSSSFWVHLNSISKTLFSSYDVQNTFILLTALCKVSWLGISSDNTGEAAPRHLGNKLLGLDGLFEFCRVAGQNLLLSKIFGYQIRRLVVSVIFVNTKYAMAQPRVFSKLLRLVTILWENWREHIRLEFPVLCEQLIIKVLQAPSLKMYPIYQYLALEEVVRWFEQPHMLVEMFVNFDMDTAIVSDWNIFAHLIRVVCKLAEKAASPSSSGHSSDGGPWPTPHSEAGYADTLFGSKAVPITHRHVKVKALDVAANMTRAMMDAAGHSNLISQDIIGHSSSSPWLGTDSDADNVGNENEENTVVSRRKKAQSMRIKIETYQKGADVLKEGIEIYKKKGSIKKCVAYLVSKGFMTDSARDAASFLRLYRENFDPASIGDYLGEGGKPDTSEEAYWSMVRYQYTRAASFVDLPLDVALRLFLTGCGFRMPGEAQKIERFVYTFTRCFWEDNRNSEYLPFSHEDTVLLVVYATIMLNTDLHHANNDKKRAKDKMTLNQFIRNLRGCDQDKDVDPEYLTSIYNGIKEHPIDWVDNDFLHDSVDDNAATDAEQNRKYLDGLIRHLRTTEDLLRSFSQFTYHFGIMGVDLSISMELITYMFETVWEHFRSVADILLKKLANEETVLFSALDVAVNSLTSCIFVDMKVQKIAFLRQVTAFREMLQELDSREDSKSKLKNSKKSFSKSSDAWYDNVEKSTSATAIPIVAEVHGILTEMKDVVRRCARREATKHVFARIESKAGITDANRFIILEADLKKISNKNGKFVTYRFFLFSDILVYAHHGFTSSYKVHLQMKLVDTTVYGIVAGDETGCCFSVSNPAKSFIVCCSSVAEKQQWFCAIKDASEACLLRKTGQRFSMLKRMQSQELEASERQQLHAKALSPKGDDDNQRRPSDPFVEVPKGLNEHRRPLPNILSSTDEHDDTDENSSEEKDECKDDQFVQSPIEKCSDYVTSLDKVESSKVFVKALKYWKSQLDSDINMSADVKLKLYGLYKTAKDGPAPPSSPRQLAKAKARNSVVLTLQDTDLSSDEASAKVAERQMKAWQDCGDLSNIEAMRRFIVTLFSVHPHWDYHLH